MQMKEDNLVPDDIFASYNNYHFALVYKLECAHYYLEKLSDLLESDLTENISTSGKNFNKTVNRNIDGFFYSSGSALDILAREVLSYYGETLPERVYFHTAYNTLSQRIRDSAILEKLRTPSWKELFSDYRNTLTHELILANALNLNIRFEGDKQISEIIIFLPDDPKLKPEDRTFDKKIEVLEYTTTSFRKQVSLINQIYGEILSNIKLNNQFPLQ